MSRSLDRDTAQGPTLPALGPGRPTRGRAVLHVEVDRFALAVELRRRPELRGRPVVVGGRGDAARGAVVTSVSPEAQAGGVEAGMPLRVATRRTPDAVVLPLDVPACRAAAREVEAALRRVPGAWEIAGWGEASLESPGERPLLLARLIRSVVTDATGFTCSVGIGENRLQARVASHLAKPGGIVRLAGPSWKETVGTGRARSHAAAGLAQAPAAAGRVR